MQNALSTPLQRSRTESNEMQYLSADYHSHSPQLLGGFPFNTSKALKLMPMLHYQKLVNFANHLSFIYGNDPCSRRKADLVAPAVAASCVHRCYQVKLLPQTNPDITCVSYLPPCTIINIHGTYCTPQTAMGSLIISPPIQGSPMNTSLN